MIDTQGKPRLRKLLLVEEQLSDLLRDLQFSANSAMCDHCGAYKSRNNAESEALGRVGIVLSEVRKWMTETWVHET